VNSVLPVADEEATYEGQQEQNHGHIQLEPFMLIFVFSSALQSVQAYDKISLKYKLKVNKLRSKVVYIFVAL